MRLEEGKTYTVREHLSAPVNTPHDTIYKNIRGALRRQSPQLQVFPENDYKAMLLCGGPTLADHLPEIRRKRKKGTKLLTVNNVHEWVQDQGMVPSMQIMLDAREHNARFVTRPVHGCRYMLCNQTHPAVWDALKGFDTWIWHPGAGPGKERRMLDRYYRKRWIPVLGGTSVGPRAITIAYMVGIRQLDVYGLDGCLMDGKHHAYQQEENDLTVVNTVRIGRKKFKMHGWMVKQLDEMMQILPVLPDDYRLTIHGRGAISHLINTFAAQKSPPKVEVLDTYEA